MNDSYASSEIENRIIARRIYKRIDYIMTHGSIESVKISSLQDLLDVVYDMQLEQIVSYNVYLDVKREINILIGKMYTD